MLQIKNLHTVLDGKQILRGLDLNVGAGQVHAIMGPNGAGKSTLSYTVAGRAGYEVAEGSIVFNGVDITHEAPHERAAQGLFLGFQYPVEIPGVTNMTFLKTAVNAQRKARGDAELDAMGFLKLIRAKAKDLGIEEAMLKRSVNMGFSGGEKKRNEMLQMALLEPKLAILDETDSGLDIDALKTVADGINRLRSPERSIVLITHYQRLLDYVQPDVVHILAGGKIVKSGDKTLAHKLEAEGYEGIIASAA
ncbi:MAG: Fe-S cluster assembly ATPase SufC [Alphaproteobacteria bacterium]|nr:Fe-S cluster assembly ATPase SufC [Alphaproteobacteria bacterium]